MMGWCLGAGAEDGVQALPALTSEGLAVPRPGARFVFPRDHGSHPEFGIEWWYLTGHLESAQGRRWGYQATFFRRAAPRTSPEAAVATSASFGTGQVYLAHMALLEVATGRFVHQERLNREGWDAGASTNQLEVRNGNWWLRQEDAASADAGPVLRLSGGIRAEAAFGLTLVPAKPLVVFGTNGVSRKAAEPTAASHYLTFTRLKTTGELVQDGLRHEVTGETWMDHEFSSSQLGAGQVGWDWACLQLADGREVMAYRMRRTDGSTDPFSTLAWIDREGNVQQVGAEQFRWEAVGTWRSPGTGAEYPAGVRLTTRDPGTGREVVFRVEPLVANQELTGAIGGIPYWEGACRVRDEDGREVGRAFLEMTGYAATMQGKL
jgi:predicted secreted hydrolase